MPGMALQEEIGAIALGDLRVTDETVDRLAKVLRRCSYFLAFLSFATFARWIKVPRSDLPIYNVWSQAEVIDRQTWFMGVFGSVFIVFGLAGCDNTNVYGSVGVGVSSSGFNGHGSNNRRMHGSISVGGRIR